MDLSVIIVSFNVKYFLEQCLASVSKAIGKIEAEVIVIDNHSSDGSIDYLRAKFDWVHFIASGENGGFARANNQALASASGTYILFLNPDTIIAEDSFQTCISFLESNARAGAVGLRMIDGSGQFLKESKRGFPTPMVSFFKLSGLSRLFPHSAFFARYYLGNLDGQENQVMDVIAGAYFFTRKEVLDKTGGFDERFFMYAEDIDLSCRIQQSGYLNYYLAESTIIHFKGESTRRDFRYVKLFYRAMSQFSRKHFSGRSSRLFLALMDAAIWFRAGLSATRNFFSTRQAVVKGAARYFLRGDPQTMGHVRNAITAAGAIVADDEAAADAIIFCEGKSCSFKQIIGALAASSSKILYQIHAANSSCAVGSHSREMSGEVIVI
jgi:N-acetylglucosaminyl-diphospho-decaprenol L-rhamnosyltransferase